MHALTETTDALAIDLARETVYRFLASALRDPCDPHRQRFDDPEAWVMLREAVALLREEACQESTPLGFGELPPDLFDSGPTFRALEEQGRSLDAEYDRVFGLVPLVASPPYETEFHAAGETFFRSQQMADIAGFYAAFGLEAARTAGERPDYLPLELEFMAFLAMKKRLADCSRRSLACDAAEDHHLEQIAICEEAQASFIRDHLAWWVPSFALGLRRKASGGFYRAVADMLAAFLPIERHRYHVPAPHSPVEPTILAKPEDEQSGCAGCALRG
jgi:TorA maturation chaperone TorD